MKDQVGIELGTMPAAAAPAAPAGRSRRRRRGLRVCCCVTIAVAVVAAVVVVVLATTVLKARKPEVGIEEVGLQSFSAQVRSVLPPRAAVNVTLSLVALLHNPNKVGFTYGESVASLQYYGEEVGHVGIPAGSIGPGAQERVRTSLVLQADRVASSSHLLSDVLAGRLPFSASTVLSGRVKVLRIFSRHVRVSSSCSFDILVSGPSVNDTRCDNKVRL